MPCGHVWRDFLVSWPKFWASCPSCLRVSVSRLCVSVTLMKEPVYSGEMTRSPGISCDNCGDPLVKTGRGGTPQRYCSPRCRVAAGRAAKKQEAPGKARVPVRPHMPQSRPLMAPQTRLAAPPAPVPAQMEPPAQVKKLLRLAGKGPVGVRCGDCGGTARQVWRFTGLAGESFRLALCRACAPERSGNLGCDARGVLWTAALAGQIAKAA